MLYDNSQLARVYLHAWQVTGSEFLCTITEEILDYVVREMLDPAGGFYSTQDADSEGEEGKFFAWTVDEIRELLSDEADSFVVAYGVTRHGNTSTGIARLYDTSYDHTPSGGMLSQYPLGFGQWLQALSYALSRPSEIALTGDPKADDTQALLRVVRSGYRPLSLLPPEPPRCWEHRSSSPRIARKQGSQGPETT